MVSFITAVAYHFSPGLPAAFTQLGTSTLAHLCTYFCFHGLLDTYGNGGNEEGEGLALKNVEGRVALFVVLLTSYKRRWLCKWGTLASKSPSVKFVCVVTKQDGELLYDFMVLVANVSIPTFVSLLSIVH